MSNQAEVQRRYRQRLAEKSKRLEDFAFWMRDRLSNAAPLPRKEIREQVNIALGYTE